MPALDLAGHPARDRAPLHRLWLRELRATLALSGPLVLINLAQHGLILADTVMLGRLGAGPLAAATLAHGLYFILFIAGLGLTGTVAPLIAEARGRDGGETDAVRRTLRAGIWAATLVSVPMMALLWFSGPLLAAIGEPPALAEAAGAYMRVLQWAMWPALLFMALRGALAALERPGWALVASLAALPLNIALGLWLAFPAGRGLGMAGIGLATVVSAAFSLALLATVVLGDRRLHRYRLLHGVWRFDPALLRRVFRLGLPIAATGLAEAGLFEAAALGMGLFGASQLAAHAVAIQIAAFCFMVPNGVAQAATVRVGLAFGRRSAAGVRRAGLVALGLAFAFMTLCALTQFAIPAALTGLFLDLGEAANAAVLPVAVAFIGFAALFAVADGVQSVALGMLRGLQDTRVPMWIAIGGYWGLGVPLGAGLAWGAGYEGYGIWTGFCAGLFVVATLLVLRWRRLTAGAMPG
ncbi:MATE family efflux transporter [Methylobacterium oryzihabitans]|uniref:MATE family efflux transporter n=1 Tax=Methylobacterium oryzihabitans TaxID=2499852 RepID=A0A437NSZ8_9HYPH|nr:MATE family efflux transporter [Methylobacterium oryzihabitans]RVU13124.1 MATE family efflux transporter [Methylobacterium oryzihabitans]